MALDDAENIQPISPRVAAREAYLAMLHAAQARIAATGRKVPATHMGVSVVIGELYRDTDFPAQTVLSQAENWKLAADYGRGKAATASDAEDVIEHARHFVARMTADIGEDKLEQTVDTEAIAALQAMKNKPRA